jgi:hypothetical protein
MNEEKKQEGSMNRVWIRYLRDGGNRPIGCAAVSKDGYYGLSLCSPLDTFTKKRARMIALGRLRSMKYEADILLQELTMLTAHQVLDPILGNLLVNVRRSAEVKLVEIALATWVSICKLSAQRQSALSESMPPNAPEPAA